MNSEVTKYKGAWSHSKLRDFETCKAQFKRRHLEKLPEPKSDALEWGSEVHEAIEAWLNNWKKDVHEGFEPMLAELTKLKKLRPLTETMWAHRKDWHPLADAFDRAAWARGKLDAILVGDGEVHVFDWKTGRPKEASQSEKSLMGMGAGFTSGAFRQRGKLATKSRPAHSRWLQTSASTRRWASTLRASELRS